LKNRGKGATRGALRGALLGFIGAIAVAACSCALVWPIWYLATAHTRLFTALSLVLIIAGIVYSAVVRIGKRRSPRPAAALSPALPRPPVAPDGPSDT